MTTSDGLSVQLLGPVRAWRAGAAVDVGAARRRAVFAVLAVRAGQAVSRDELIGGVWGDSPPATAGASLYTYVSGLRRAFEPQRSKRSAAEVIVSTGGGYSLRVDPDCLDVHRFERHRSRAQALAGEHPARALAELDRALALWRGDALHDVPGPFAEAQRARLLELRLATVERRAELALALGRHADVVAGLADLAAEHPVREGLHALLVTALHRAGRRAEALAVYRDAHRALVDGLGIEPGSALRRAHREVLGADAAGVGRVDRRAPDDSAPEADHPDWWAPDDSAAGDDALGWWGSDDSATAADHPGWWAADDSAPEGGEQDWWAPDGGATAADHPDRWVLGDGTAADRRAPRAAPAATGPAFVGREREVALLRAAVADVAAGRGRCVWLEGEPGSGKTALLTAGLAGAADLGCRVARVAVDELGARCPLPPARDGADPVTGRQPAAEGSPADLSEAGRLVELVVGRSAGGPLVLVLDGLQWADEDSVAAWADLAARRLPLLLVAAARPAPRRADVARARRAFAEAGGDVVELGPLPADDVAALVAGLVGAPAGDNLRRFAAGAGGNPRYAREAVDALVRDGLVEHRDGVAEIDADTAGQAPPSLVPVLTGWLGFLSPGAAEALRWVALLDDGCTALDAATAAGRPAADLAAAVDEAVAAGVLVATGPRLAFRHRLLRHALYQQMPYAVRTALHRQAAQSLADAGAPVEVVAAQLVAAPTAADPWVAGWLAATAPALEERAPDAAVRLLRVAADQSAADPAVRDRLAARLADLLFRLGRWPDAEARHVLARTAEPGLAAGARGLLLHLRHRDGTTRESAEALRAAVADDGVPAVWRARLEALQAGVAFRAGDRREAEEAAWRAVRRAGDARDRFAAAHAWQVLWLAGCARLDHPEALDRIERALAVAREGADLRAWHALLSTDKAATLRHLDRLAEADLVLRGSDPAGCAGPDVVPDLAPAARAVQDYWAGRWDDADRRGPGGSPAHGVGALVAVRRGRVVAGGDLLDADPTAPHESAGFATVAEAFRAEADGRPDLAIAALEPLVREPRPLWRHQWLPLLARLALAAGRRDVAVCAARAGAQDAVAERAPAGATAAAGLCRGLLDGDPRPA